MKSGSVLTGLFTLILALWLVNGSAHASDNPMAEARTALDAGDFKAAAEILQHLASQGDPNAQINLGMLYLQGKGVPKDEAEAASLFEQSARQGNPSAAMNLGIMFRNGQGVATDPAHAYMWLQVAMMGLTGRDRSTASRYSNDIAKEMSPEQLQEAKDMVENCRDVGVKYCD